jgi:hypothetical protein
MPILVQVDTRRRLVVAKVLGDFTIEEIVKGIDDSVNDPNFEPGFDVLSDHSEIGTPISVTQAKQMIAHLESVSHLMAGARWAVVAPKPASYGMMRMLAVLAERVPMKVEVFQTLDEAQAWLSGPKQK